MLLKQQLRIRWILKIMKRLFLKIKKRLRVNYCIDSSDIKIKTKRKKNNLRWLQIQLMKKFLKVVFVSSVLLRSGTASQIRF